MNNRIYRSAIAGAIVFCVTASADSAFAGTWTPLTNQPTFDADTALLLTDGTVMVHVLGAEAWWLLKPDVTVSYVDGSWRQLASMPAGYTPTFFASAVLPDGRVIVEGGEYNDGIKVLTSLGALYDPAANTWTAITAPAGWTNIGDAQSVVLPNGTFMLADALSSSEALFNASTLTWTATGTGKADRNDEEGWTLLPDGHVLTVDTENGTASELYDPSTGAWTFAGSTGQSLVDSVEEIGPALLLPDGRVFATGANGNTAIYGTNGVWTAGPPFPVTSDGLVACADAPGALLPSGNVLIAASPPVSEGLWPIGVHFLEFDGTSFAEVPRTPNAPSIPAYRERFLLLPTGQVLETDNTTSVLIYEPTGAPEASWAPAIASVPSSLDFGSTETITGTQFNGLSQAVAYGDDAQMATNYPLVRVTNPATGHVFYFKTHGHSTMGVATGSQLVSTSFDVPDGIETGSMQLQVVANGIASPAVSVSVVNPACVQKRCPPLSSWDPGLCQCLASCNNWVNGHCE